MANRLAALFQQKTTAPPPDSAYSVTRPALQGKAKASVWDPMQFRLSQAFDNDPLYQAIKFTWSDRQQHGRLAYDTVYKHASAGAPFDTLVAFLKSFRIMYKAPGASPSERAKQYANYMNDQVRRLGASGDSRQGYEKLIEWFGQGMKYGFSLAEMVTVREPWGGQDRVQIERIIPFPQSSLDSGYNPLEEYGDLSATTYDVRYKCFSLDMQSRVLKVMQYYRNGGKLSEVSWSGQDLLRILHYTHGGTEGNPYGQSIFFTAYYHWADLYTLELMEQAFLDAGLPYLGISYKTPDGRPSPAIHTGVLELIEQQDPRIRALMIPNATFSSVAASNPSFTEHVTKKKEELRAYIRQSIFGANLTEAGATRELDARNVIQVFFKYLLPALQREISTLLTWQFARRLIDANWSDVKPEEYPEVEFQNVLDNDLRVATPMLQQALPFIDSERLGEFLARVLPGFDATWIPEDHSSSVSKKRETADPAAGAKSGTPPTKQEGSPDERSDGQTGNVGGEVDVTT